MKYRLRLDLSFDNQADAQALLDFAKTLRGKAAGVNTGKTNEEAAFCEMEICRHEEGLPCTRLERLEIGKV